MNNYVFSILCFNPDSQYTSYHKMRLLHQLIWYICWFYWKFYRQTEAAICICSRCLKLLQKFSGKCPCVRFRLQSLKFQISHLLRASSSLTLDSRVCDMICMIKIQIQCTKQLSISQQSSIICDFKSDKKISEI